MDEERLMEPELVAMQRVARELENERDAALLDARTAQGMLQGWIDQANENAIRVCELEGDLEAARRQSIILVKRVAEANAKEFVLEGERDAAVTREAVLQRALETFPFDEYGRAQREGCDANAAWDCFVTEAEKHIEAALANSSPAAEALLELAAAAEQEWHNWQHGLSGRVGEDLARLHRAVEKWRRARG